MTQRYIIMAAYMGRELEAEPAEGAEFSTRAEATTAAQSLQKTMAPNAHKDGDLYFWVKPDHTY